MFPPRKIIVVAIAVILSCPVPQYGTNRTPGIHKKTVQAILSLRGTVCGNGKERTALQRCTQNAGKRFTFATGQCRERHHRRCGNGLERTALQRCTQMRENGSPLQLGNTGNATTGPVEMVRSARRCKGAPKMRENGSPLQLGNTGNAATGAVEMVRNARHETIQTYHKTARTKLHACP